MNTVITTIITINISTITIIITTTTANIIIIITSSDRRVNEMQHNPLLVTAVIDRL
jgi:hypothetical protein